MENNIQHRNVFSTLEDSFLDSTESIILNPIDSAIKSVESSKVNNFKPVKRVSGITKDISGSTRILIKLRRNKKNKKKKD